MAWLVYGQRADGEVLHISEVERGEECGCFCPHCQGALAAKKGKVKVHHFAHLGKTCAYVSAYDFLHIEHAVDTTLSLTQWASWKQADMDKTGVRLQAELDRYRDEMAGLLPLIDQARSRLVTVSEKHPSRKQRSKTRQANFEVLQQWDAYLADHNAGGPDLERVRDLQSTEYRELYYRAEGRWSGQYVTGLCAWPNELWHEANKDRNWIPWWLEQGGLALLNEYDPLRRKLATAELHRAAFYQEKMRLDRFRLYFLLIEFASRPALFKIGITSRADLTERIAELQADLQPYQVVGLTPLIELPGYACLETYFKHKYAPQQTKLGQLTEYFAFSDEQVAVILRELRELPSSTEAVGKGRRQQIRQGMAQAREQGVHIGRPTGSEGDQRFLQKPKSRQIAATLVAHPDWSLRAVARHTGLALNTICKVARLLDTQPGLASADVVS